MILRAMIISFYADDISPLMLSFRCCHAATLISLLLMPLLPHARCFRFLRYAAAAMMIAAICHAAAAYDAITPWLCR